MKVVNQLAEVDSERCKGCQTCARVCPTLAIKIVLHKAKIDAGKCRGCNNCEQRCPEHAISMVMLDEPLTVQADVSLADYGKIQELCRAARFNPEQLLCYCTGTRAEEVAAAILQGARSPEEISLATGIRTGCKVECIQPVLRLLESAGINPKPPAGGWQWYGRTVTAWEVPEEVRKKYARRGFYFDDDVALLNRVLKAGSEGSED